MTLFLCAQDIRELWVGLVKDASFLSKERFEVSPEQHLATIDAFLQSEDVSLDEIVEIVVVSGPGSFTASRVSTTIANAMAFTKDIPIRELHNEEGLPLETLLQKEQVNAPGSLAQPYYNRPPRVT